MSAPAWTYNSQGNALASSTVTNGTPATFTVDFSTVMMGQLQVEDTGWGTVSGTACLQVSIYYVFTTDDDTVPISQFTITTVASTSEWQSITLPTGKYFVTLGNLDASHTVTAVATTNTLSWPS